MLPGAIMEIPMPDGSMAKFSMGKQHNGAGA